MVDTQPIGKRRQLVKSLLHLQAFKDTTESLTQNYSNTKNGSECHQSFCDSDFTPTLDNKELLPNKEHKYPLDSSIPRTIYTQKVMEGILKVNSLSLNLKEPFRKDNIITADIKTTLKKL